MPSYHMDSSVPPSLKDTGIVSAAVLFWHLENFDLNSTVQFLTVLYLNKDIGCLCGRCASTFCIAKTQRLKMLPIVMIKLIDLEELRTR